MHWILIIAFINSGAVTINMDEQGPAKCREAAVMWNHDHDANAWCYETRSNVILNDAIITKKE